MAKHTGTLFRTADMVGSPTPALARMRLAHRLPQVVGLAAIAAAVAIPEAAWSAQTTIDISTTAAPATPRIQGPLTFSAFPSSPFLFAIPATGTAPLTYSATGLPSGLTLAADTGVISGTTPSAGSYPVTVTVTNSTGSATADFTLVSGDTLCLTPPVGWNSYDSFGASVTESDVLAEAKDLKARLQPYGWSYVVIDYRWYEPENNIDSNGRYLPSPSKYPSATGNIGFKSLADKVHAMGLGFGIHIMRGIPRKSFDANTPIANSTYKAQDAGNSSDACPWDTHMWGVRGDTTAGQDWYSSLAAQYAQWGVDFIKIDDMINNDTHTYHQSEVDALHKAIRSSGRSIVLSLSPGPIPTSAAADLDGNANLWRSVNDFWDYNGLSTLDDVFTALGGWQAVTSLTAGHWADGDMLPLGYLGPRNEWHASGQTTFSKNEQVTIMSLWGIAPSPLIFGGNVSSLSSDAWTTALLTNEEVMAVNQDASGTHGKRIAQQGSTEVWTRDLTGGRKAVALFNRGSQDATVSATFAQLGITGTPAIRDLWHRQDVAGMTTGLSATVPYKGALMYVLSPTGTGAGGAPGNGGSGGAGARGSGGAADGGSDASGSGGTSAPPAGGGGGRSGGGGAITGGITSNGGAIGMGGATVNGGSSGGPKAGGAGGGAVSPGGAGSGGASTGPAASGGSPAGAGGAASGGASGSGEHGSGGALSTGGTTATGGSVSGQGGTAGSGGAGGARAGTGPISRSSPSNGCSCVIGSQPNHGAELPTALLLIVMTVLGWRRRSSAESKHNARA